MGRHIFEGEEGGGRKDWNRNEGKGIREVGRREREDGS